MRNRLLSLVVIFAILLSGCSVNLNAVSLNKFVKVDVDTIIVGGGIAGLTSAFYLHDHKQDFILLEKEATVGGKTIGGKKDGFYYAKGTEYIGEPDGLLGEMIEELDIDLIEIPSPMDIHYSEGKRYYGDTGLALHLIEESSIEEYNRFVGEVMDIYDEYEELPDFDPSSELAKLDKITASQWLKENDFSSVYYDVYNVTSKGLFGATLDEVSALNMIPEIAFDFTEESYVNKSNFEEMKADNVPYKEREGSNAFTFKKGMSEIPLAIYEKFEKKIRLSCEVNKVEKVNGKYRVTYYDEKSNKISILTSNNVILAVPSPIVPILAKDLLTKSQMDIIDRIPYANYITAALYTDTYIFDESFDLAVPDNWFFTDVYDSTWVQREYDPAVKNSENSIVSFYIAPKSYKSSELKKMSDKVVLENIYAELDKMPEFENLKEHVTGYDIYRMGYAYPVMIPGAYERLQKLHDELNGSFQLAGDYMVYPTLEGAVESGAIAARKIVLLNKK